MYMRTDILERESDIKRWVSEKRSKSYICTHLHCKMDTVWVGF